MKFSCRAVVFLAYDVAGNRSRRVVLNNVPLVGSFCFGRLCFYLCMDVVTVYDGPR